MSRIDEVEFMLRLDALFVAAGEPPARAGTGRDGGVTGFAERYGRDGGLLEHMAASADDDPGLARLARALEDGLREGRFETEAPSAPRSFIRYVYPVV